MLCAPDKYGGIKEDPFLFFLDKPDKTEVGGLMVDVSGKNIPKCKIFREADIRFPM